MFLVLFWVRRTCLVELPKITGFEPKILRTQLLWIESIHINSVFILQRVMFVEDKFLCILFSRIFKYTGGRVIATSRVSEKGDLQLDLLKAPNNLHLGSQLPLVCRPEVDAL